MGTLFLTLQNASMPRQARLDASGALHHIMVRGINESAIFKDDPDKTRFLERLGEIILEAGCAVFAWVLMDNHAPNLILKE
jgi:REP element-mobilizing transposase RayT